MSLSSIPQILLLIGIVVLYGSLFITFFSHAPYVPSRKKELARLIGLAGIKPGDHVVDFGSGDGRVVLAAARAGAHAVGIERQPLLVWISRLWAWRAGLTRRARFRVGNLFNADLTNADVVICYLLPDAMKRLREKFETEMKPGSRVVVNAFAIAGWEPSVESRDGQTAPVFVYQR